ncbi:RNA-guided endonuclease TnpB family protein [Streptomyces cyaneofuscatus]|uniref:RNA-guided endonuclease TnpB family protein n=1 Tax=Streptomyces cyaneofuscatus TaxID=66883 RepID=UPI003649E7F5
MHGSCGAGHRAWFRLLGERKLCSGPQAAELSRTFGCVRKVCNLALAARSEAWTRRQERVNYNATSAMLTTWKKTEDLTVRNMVKNRSLARAISDAAWTTMRGMLEYKCAWYGRDLVAIDRWFPSSKLCSACGTLQGKMPLNVRTWTCACGVTHDRDVNAAKNVLAEGLSVTVCGAGVRPQRSSPGGQSATKQKNPRREP